MPVIHQTSFASDVALLSFVPFPGNSIMMSDKTYRGYMLSQQWALESAVLTGYRGRRNCIRTIKSF